MIKENIQEIMPETGLGVVQFGMTREEVTAIMGKPSEVEAYNYEDGGDKDKTEAWHYDDLELSLSFDEDQDWKLTSIAASGGDYTIDGRNLFGISKDELIIALKEMDIEDIEEDDWSDDEMPEHVLISAEDIGVNFWLDGGVVSEIQWSALYLDDDTVEWPEKE